MNRNKLSTLSFGVLLALSTGLTVVAQDDVDPNQIAFQLVAPEFGIQAGTTEEIRLDVSSPFAFQGCSASIAYDPDTFDLVGHNDDETIIETLGGADFVDFTFDDDVGYLTIGVLLRTTPPFDQTIPSFGFPMTMMNIEVSAPDDVATQVSRFRFVNGFGTPPKFNVIVHDNISERPDRLDDALIPVFGAGPFIRGDVNQDGDVDMTDGIMVLRVVILGDGEFECEKAADANDTAHVDFSDGIYLLQFLFLGAAPPPSPFPDSGFDNRPEYHHLRCMTSYFSTF